MDVRVGQWRGLSPEELIRLNYGAGEDSWESLGQQKDQTSQFLRKSTLNILWKDWCWSWSSNTLATWCREPTYWKRPWCWKRLREGEGDNRGWDDWMASLTKWTWVWASPGSWWWTGKPRVLWSMGSQRVRHNWGTELNWCFWADGKIQLKAIKVFIFKFCAYCNLNAFVAWNFVMESSLPPAAAA